MTLNADVRERPRAQSGVEPVASKIRSQAPTATTCAILH
jgi:hypothetical protein